MTMVCDILFNLLYYSLGVFFMKDHLTYKYAVFMLLGAALGSGFLSLPYAMQKFPWESNYIGKLISLL